MNDRRDNVVKFKPPPKRPDPPRPKRRPNGEPAINWSRAPKAIVLIVIFMVFMWLVGGLAGWISGIGVG